jgi:predicted transcriptional regulator
MDNIHELVYGLRDKDKETMQKLIFKDIEKSLELIGKI